LDNLINTVSNHKSKLIEWAQANSKKINFELINQKTHGNINEFTVQVLINDEPIATGSGLSKKKAEQAAAEKSLVLLTLQPSG
ncbi:MAG: ribonuclease III, partial [Moraxellaceae bacterium]